MQKMMSFLEWMDEDTTDVENVTLSLRGNILSVKGEKGDFDIQLNPDQVSEVAEKMKGIAAASGDAGQDSNLPSNEEPKDDEEDQVAPSVGGVGRLSGM